MLLQDYYINERLLRFAAYLGSKYNARVISWGRDPQGNKDVGGLDDSWHLWNRGANAIDLKPFYPSKTILSEMAREAKEYGFQVEVYETSIHIEEPW